eukprot:CFRG6298T1
MDVVKWRLVNTPTGRDALRPRHGHRAVGCGSNMIVYGGGNEGIIDELRVFDTINMVWSVPTTTGEYPKGCAAHGMTTDGVRRVFIYGGMAEYGEYSSLLYELDVVRWNWICPETTGTSPGARLGLSANYVNNCLYVFGGVHKAKGEIKYSNDMYSLNLETKHWTRIDTEGEQPAPRESHTCCAYGNDLVMYGGMNGKRLGDVWVFSTELSTWRRIEVLGKAPRPRSLHTMVVIGKKAFMFAGWTSALNRAGTNVEWECTNSLACLDLEKWEWKEIYMHGAHGAHGDGVPKARAGHCAAAVGSRAFVWSGRDGYRVNQNSQVCCQDLWLLETAPPPKCSSFMTKRLTALTCEGRWEPVTTADAYRVHVSVCSDVDVNTANVNANVNKRGTGEMGASKNVKNERGNASERVDAVKDLDAVVDVHEGAVLSNRDKSGIVGNDVEVATGPIPSVWYEVGYVKTNSISFTEFYHIPTEDQFQHAHSHVQTTQTHASTQDSAHADVAQMIALPFSSPSPPLLLSHTNTNANTLVDDAETTNTKKNPNTDSKPHGKGKNLLRLKLTQSGQACASVLVELDKGTANKWVGSRGSGSVEESSHHMQDNLRLETLDSISPIGGDVDGSVGDEDLSRLALKSLNSLNKFILSPNTTFRIRVAAINWCGQGEWSEPTEFSTKPCTIPSIPGPLHFQITGTNMYIEWTAPVECGGKEVQSYRVDVAADGVRERDMVATKQTYRHKPNSAALPKGKITSLASLATPPTTEYETVYHGISTNCTVNIALLSRIRLSDGGKIARYWFRVRAENAIGPSAFSEASLHTLSSSDRVAASDTPDSHSDREEGCAISGQDVKSTVSKSTTKSTTTSTTAPVLPSKVSKKSLSSNHNNTNRHRKDDTRTGNSTNNKATHSTTGVSSSGSSRTPNRKKKSHTHVNGAGGTTKASGHTSRSNIDKSHHRVSMVSKGDKGGGSLKRGISEGAEDLGRLLQNALNSRTNATVSKSEYLQGNDSKRGGTGADTSASAGCVAVCADEDVRGEGDSRRTAGTVDVNPMLPSAVPTSVYSKNDDVNVRGGIGGSAGLSVGIGTSMGASVTPLYHSSQTNPITHMNVHVDQGSAGVVYASSSSSPRTSVNTHSSTTQHNVTTTSGSTGPYGNASLYAAPGSLRTHSLSGHNMDSYHTHNAHPLQVPSQTSHHTQQIQQPYPSPHNAREVDTHLFERVESVGSSRSRKTSERDSDGHGESKKIKRVRRPPSEIERAFLCDIPECNKGYGSQGALDLHRKTKHDISKKPKEQLPHGQEGQWLG